MSSSFVLTVAAPRFKIKLRKPPLTKSARYFPEQPPRASLRSSSTKQCEAAVAEEKDDDEALVVFGELQSEWQICESTIGLSQTGHRSAHCKASLKSNEASLAS